MSKTKKLPKVQKSTKSVLFENPKGTLYQYPPTKAEQEVLSLIGDPFFYSPSQIAKKRGCKLSIIYRHIRNLRKKGLLQQKTYIVQNRGVATPKSVLSENKIRLHNEHYHIKIRHYGKKYQKVEPGTITELKGNTIVLNERSIDVYSNTDFYGLSEEEATSKALTYWPIIISSIEQTYGVLLQKERGTNIVRVRAHYERTNDPLAEKCIKDEQKISIRGDDGKVWLIVDRSPDESGNPGYNLETIHPKRSGEDMGKIIEPWANDMRDNKHFLPSEVRSSILNLLKIQQDTNESIGNNAKTLQVLLNMIMPQKEQKKKETQETKPDYVI